MKHRSKLLAWALALFAAERDAARSAALREVRKWEAEELEHLGIEFYN